MSDLAGVADELYALDPDEFTAARNDRAKAIEDKGLAKQIRALRKPSLAAWTVNMLARHEAGVVEQVLDLGGSLRQAQADLDGAGLRELNKQRRRLISAVTGQARQLAADHDHRLGDAAARQVEETLHAAMTDEGAARAVRSGLLTAALSATGLGPVDLSGAVAVPSAEEAPTPVESRTKRPALTVVPDDPDEPDVADDEARKQAQQEAQKKAQKKAQGEAEAAEAAAAEAEKELTKAQRRVSELEARSLQLEAELEEVRRRAGELEHELDSLGEELGDAQTERDEREGRRTESERAADRARTALEQLQTRR